MKKWVRFGQTNPGLQNNIENSKAHIHFLDGKGKKDLEVQYCYHGVTMKFILHRKFNVYYIIWFECQVAKEIHYI